MDKETYPFSRPPLNILVNPEAIRSKKPWEIDLTGLLDIFIKIVESGRPDLRLCGSVALSSALIYRLKVETLFLFEKLKIEKRSTNIMEPPQVLVMPFRHELYTTTIEDLISALERTLQDILTQSRREKPKPHIIEPETLFEIDQTNVNIKEALLAFKERLLGALAAEREIFFSKYVRDLPITERVRIFILLLFVAMEGIVSVEEVGEDIKITGGLIVDR